jgi:translation initiation factor 1A
MFIAKPVKYYVDMYYIHNMPRNTGGGNKAKKFASKSFIVSDRATRFASVEGEVYAVVQRMLGGTICEVLCIDGIIRLCIIRGKFSGKGKRDNRLSKGSWILVGLRDWEISSKEKPKCDLLEVYNDTDKEKLIKNSRENFRIFLSTNEDDTVDEDQLKFVNEREELLTQELAAELANKEEENEEDKEVENKKMSSVLDQMSWIDINDI